MALIGQQAPKFKAPAVVDGNRLIEDFTLDAFLNDKYVLLLFYPTDFALLSPGELLEVQRLLPEFEKRQTVVVACSTDSQFAHIKWLQLPEEQGGIKGVTFPLISDRTLMISRNFDVLAGDLFVAEDGSLGFDGEPISHRASFIIDKDGVVRYQEICDVFMSRNPAKYLDILDALLHFEKTGESIPIGWKNGEKGVNFK